MKIKDAVYVLCIVGIITGIWFVALATIFLCGARDVPIVSSILLSVSSLVLSQIFVDKAQKEDARQQKKMIFKEIREAIERASKSDHGHMFVMGTDMCDRIVIEVIDESESKIKTVVSVSGEGWIENTQEESK